MDAGRLTWTFVQLARTVPSREKVTDPPEGTGLTVAVYVTAVAEATVGIDEVIVVVVVARMVVSDIGADVLGSTVGVPE